MAEWLQALAALKEDPGSIPSTPTAAHSPISRESDSLLWPPWAHTQ